VLIMTNTLRQSRSAHSFPVRRLYPPFSSVSRNVTTRTKHTIDQLRRDQRIHNLALDAAALVGGYESQLCGRLQGPISTSAVSIQPEV
jgi:hypothetical protein